MYSLASEALDKIRVEGFSSLMKDAFYYMPLGMLSTQIKTPEDVVLELDGMSPVTIGRYRAGDNERDEFNLISECPENLEVIELGAGTGYLTAIMNRKTKNSHIAVEPNPVAFSALCETLSNNNVNYKPINKAYHPTNEVVEFPKTKYFKTNSLADDTGDSVEIESTSLSELLDVYELEKPLIHVDIEGGEKLLLEEEIEVIRNRCSGVLIEFHPWRLNKEVDQYIQELNKSDSFSVISRRDNIALFL